jgi:hypothetical protein
MAGGVGQQRSMTRPVTAVTSLSLANGADLLTDVAIHRIRRNHHGMRGAGNSPTFGSKSFMYAALVHRDLSSV